VNVFYKQLINIIVVLALCGCASLARDEIGTTDSTAAEPLPGSLPDGEGWWYARFHIDWPEGEPARWYMGTLIGGEVIAPVFDEYYQDVLIWRVHRRASRDGYGHVFSFIFYSTPQGAQRIYTAIENNAVVQSLLDSGRLTRVAVDDVTRITRPNIEDTSDKHWPLSVQKTWPAMIMGTSRMWLDLVSEQAATVSATGGTEAKYQKIQDAITTIWREQGQHAMLHHINAVYAYQPLLIRY
jgi:hypothetical protein